MQPCNPAVEVGLRRAAALPATLRTGGGSREPAYTCVPMCMHMHMRTHMRAHMHMRMHMPHATCTRKTGCNAQVKPAWGLCYDAVRVS